ncbi:MAG: hypothetical protein SH809_06980 [Rhodothermales bacterium]|nr:hypothetical protein [Rhodothermales bacterium]
MRAIVAGIKKHHHLCTGRSIRIGHVGGSDTRFGIVSPDDQDWVMVFDSVPEHQMP